MGDVEVLMEVNVTGNVVIHGSVIGGRVTAGGDVTAGNASVSLLNHNHNGVKPGTGTTAAPTAGS